MKCCKIVSVWFGHRRTEFNSPVRPEDQYQFFTDYFMEHEKTVDPGVDMDLIIVNNIGPKIPRSKTKWIDTAWDNPKPFEHVHILEGSHLANEQIYTLDGEQIIRGNVRVLRRLNTAGGGFDGFAHGFDAVCDDYDYFLFCEDDVVFFKDMYFKSGIDTLKNHPNALCVGYSPKSVEQMHFGGGLLLSDREKLKSLAEHWTNEHLRRMPRKHKRPMRPRLPDNEKSFSNGFNHVGTGCSIDEKLVYVDGLDPFARNYMDVGGQRALAGLKGYVRPNQGNYAYFVGFEDNDGKVEHVCRTTGLEVLEPMLSKYSPHDLRKIIRLGIDEFEKTRN